MKKILLAVFAIALLTGCSSKVADEKDNENFEKKVAEVNPAAKGFDLTGSDEKAIALADEVMKAQGGRKNWDATKVIAWNFFGKRSLIWNKQTGDVRIDYPEMKLTWLINVFKHNGQVKKGDEVLSQPDSVAKYVKMGESIWINDSYWLIMPFKLKDSGVTLKYAREDTTIIGEQSAVLELTFQDVGETPENRYEVWVDNESKLVNQWAFYPTDTISKPMFVMPWADYKTYGNIKLSGNRGAYSLSDVKVLDEAPEGAFTSFDAVVLK